MKISTTAPPPHPRDLPRAELEALLATVLPGNSARECVRWLSLAVHRGGAISIEELGDGSPRWREAVARTMRFEATLRLEGESRLEEDGSLKLLFSVPRLGGEKIEAVAIPRHERDLTLCLSSQAGCPLACAFCATGLLGLRGNLSAAEILEQHAWAERRSGRRVTDVVFMGMGEPFLNYDAVLQAAHALHHPQGQQISHRRIILSTAGVVPRIRQYVREGHRFPVYFSITSAIPEKRRRLMPIEEQYPLQELVEAIREYQRLQHRNRWVTLAYVAMAGENMGEEDVAALGEVFRGIPYIVDVIPYNATDGRFRPPTWEEVKAFTTLLRRLDAPIKVRYSSGKKQGGGCGQLAGGEVALAAPAGHLLSPPGVFSDRS